MISTDDLLNVCIIHLNIKMITKTFNSLTNILEVTYSGDVDIRQILDYQREILFDSVLPRTLLVLTDSTKCSLVLSADEIKMIIDELEELMKKYTIIRNAFLSNSPQPTALSTLYKMHITPGLKYYFEIFSTKAAAIDFLKK